MLSTVRAHFEYCKGSQPNLVSARKEEEEVLDKRCIQYICTLNTRKPVIIISYLVPPPTHMLCIASIPTRQQIIVTGHLTPSHTLLHAPPPPLSTPQALGTLRSRNVSNTSNGNTITNFKDLMHPLSQHIQAHLFGCAWGKQRPTLVAVH